MKINLGSGQRPFGPGWCNVDCQARWNPDVVADGNSMPMFKDGSVEVIVSHHCLEHVGCGEGDGMLKECYRILQPGGSLIVTVPDMRALAMGWLARKITDQIYFTNVYGAFMQDDADRHRWGYVGVTLAETLQRAAGWGKIVTFDWREIEGASIARDWWVLAVEAVK